MAAESKGFLFATIKVKGLLENVEPDKTKKDTCIAA